MMNILYKLISYILYLLAALVVGFIAVVAYSNSTDDSCVGADEFNTRSIKVDSNPLSDGVYGVYDDIDGGQVAEWHSTGLRTSKEDFIILVSGSWVPWKSNLMNQVKLDEMSVCNICSKKTATDNCICHKGYTPQPELGINQYPVTGVDCSSVGDMNDQNKCTCTTSNGKATDYGVYHFPLNYYKKDYTRRYPDDQGDACKYYRGMGLYLGVFGRTSNETPIRAYHLFSEEEMCPVKRNSSGQCVDEEGKNRTKYVFRSANKRPLVKDDFDGNYRIDTNTANDQFHSSNEYVKLIIYDRYYSDNFGKYSVEFLKGVIDDDEIGLLEFLVKTVEDQILGELNDDGEREGGILKYLYKSIVNDSYFILIVQGLLTMYIMTYGLMYLMGLSEINKKELMSRVIKIGLIIFFVNPGGWEMYNKIVVGFFQRGMNDLIDIVVTLGDMNLDEETNPLILAQMSSPEAGNSSSRFSYIDVMLRILFSDNVTKKIFGLFFQSLYGFLYIAAIYFLIGYFLYTVLLAAITYAITLMKMIFAMALGPIFIVFSLFKQTADYFKNWLSFIGARALEMLIMFLILFTFIMLIDQKFNQLLYYEVCPKDLNFGLFSFKILMANLNRSFVEWVGQIITLGLFIYILQMILDKIPDISGSLISIGGKAAKDSNGAYGASNFALAGALRSRLLQAAFDAKDAAQTVAGAGYRAGRQAMKASGVSGLINKIPINGPQGFLRDREIDRRIDNFIAEGNKKGLKGKDLDNFVRKNIFNNKEKVDPNKPDTVKGLNSWRERNKNKAALYDMTDKAILARLDKKLVADPLKQFLKDAAKEIRSGDPNNIPLGKDMEKRLREEAKKWADKNLVGGSTSLDGHIDKFGKFMAKKGEFSAKDAAKLFSDEGLRDKFLMHLENKRMMKEAKTGKEMQDFNRVSDTAKDFVARLENKKLGFLDRLRGQGMQSHGVGGIAASNLARSLTKDAIRSRLTDGSFSREKFSAKSELEKKASELEFGSQKRALLGYEHKGKFKRGELHDQYDEIDKKREFYKKELDYMIARDVQREMQGKSREELEQMRLAAKAEVEDLKLMQRQKLNELAGDANWAETAKQNGGIEAYKDGLIDFDGRTLYEAMSRYHHMGVVNIDSVGGSSGLPQSYIEQAKSYYQQEDLKLAGLAAAVDSATTEQEKSDAMSAYKAAVDEAKQSPLPTAISVEFGASITDALVANSSNIGLTGSASDALLGVSSKHSDDFDKAMVANFEMSKLQSEQKVKMSKHELKYKEYELQNLEKNNGDAAKISALKSEIDVLNRDIVFEESRAKNIESQISSVSSAAKGY